MLPIFVYQLLGYDEDNIFLKKTNYTYEEVKEKFEVIDGQEVKFGDKYLETFYIKCEDGYIPSDLNMFFVFGNNIYIIFNSLRVLGIKSKNDKFSWKGENYNICASIKEELLHNIIFDGEKHMLSDNILQTLTYKTV